MRTPETESNKPTELTRQAPDDTAGTPEGTAGETASGTTGLVRGAVGEAVGTREGTAGGTVEVARWVWGEVARVLDVLEGAQVGALLAELEGADAVFFDGQGRSGLIARAVAMRWMHLGRSAFVAGETTTRAIGAGDLLVCLSATGRTASTVEHARLARKAGARVAALTATEDSPLGAAADVTVVVGARTLVPSRQHAGSLFEQACLIVGDSVCTAYRDNHHLSDEMLDSRHANLL